MFHIAESAYKFFLLLRREEANWTANGPLSILGLYMSEYE